MVTVEYGLLWKRRRMIVDLLVLLFSIEIMLCCNRWPPKFVQIDYVFTKIRPDFPTTQQAELVPTQLSLRFGRVWESRLEEMSQYRE